jgi:hypothetical protein
MSFENAENTAAEQVNLLMKHRYASSDFVTTRLSQKYYPGIALNR